MGLPSLAKSWQFSVNNSNGSLGTATISAQRMWRLVMAQLFAFGSGAPTCLGSSNSVAAALDNTNRWSADGNVVAANAGTAHSWIVFKMASGFGTNVQFCIDLANSNTVQGGNLIMSVSSGFTGGTTLNRPTAADEIVVATNVGMVPNNTNNSVWHMWLSTDGSIFKLFTYSNNTQTATMWLEKAVSTSAGWTIPAVATLSINTPIYGQLFGATSFGLTAKGPSGTMLLGVTTEAYGSQALGQTMTAADGIDGGFPFTTMGLYSPTVGMTGQHGRLTDIWFGSTVTNDGDTYPNDASKQFVTFADIILPWNGTTPVFA